jgi:Rod binding domain-containing protein
MNITASSSQLSALTIPSPSDDEVAGAKKVQETFTQTIAEPLFRQMLKSMHETVGKPAYFHGGRGEEMFQSQLDQVLAEQMAKSDGGSFTDSMFALQFPQQAEVLKQAAKAGTDVPTLRRF